MEPISLKTHKVADHEVSDALVGLKSILDNLFLISSLFKSILDIYSNLHIYSNLDITSILDIYSNLFLISIPDKDVQHYSRK